MSVELAILDDYQNVSLRSADWSVLGKNVNIKVFDKHLGHDEDAIARTLSDFEILVCMRERTRFPASLLIKLKKLKLIVTTGMRNLAIDMNAATSNGIKVCGTDMLRYPAAEHTIALILDLFKKISRESQAMREGYWQTSIGEGLNGKTLALLGLGWFALGCVVLGYARLG